MLTVDALETAYGVSQVLFGVSFAVDAGPGGDAARPQRHGQDHDRALDHGHRAGRGPARSTSRAGRSTACRPYRVAQAGLGLVPEGRQVFPNLTVRENLVATAANRGREPRPVDASSAVFELLSPAGGARAKPRRRALGRRAADARDRPRADDQPAAAHPRRGDRGARAARPGRDLALPGTPQGARASRSCSSTRTCATLTRIADAHYILEKGRIVWSGTSAELGARADVQHRYLGV